MTLQLIYAPASPFARKARVVIHEAGLIDRVELVDVHSTPLEQNPTLVRANPLGKLPCLVRDDGPAIYDSRVVTRYLDAIGSTSLYPPGRIWEILTLEALADGMMEAAVQIVYEDRFRAASHRHAAMMEGHRRRIERGLDAVDERWMSHLQGPLNIGHVAIGCALGYLDLRLGELDWRDGRAVLAGWYARFAERESMKATEPAG